MATTNLHSVSISILDKQTQTYTKEKKTNIKYGLLWLTWVNMFTKYICAAAQAHVILSQYHITTPPTHLLLLIRKPKKSKMLSPRSYRVQTHSNAVSIILYGFWTALELIHNFKVEQMFYSVLQLTKPSFCLCVLIFHFRWLLWQPFESVRTTQTQQKTVANRKHHCALSYKRVFYISDQNVG